MKRVVTKCLPMPLPETPVKVLGDNGNRFLADFYSPSAFFLFALAQISTP